MGPQRAALVAAVRRLGLDDAANVGAIRSAPRYDVTRVAAMFAGAPGLLPRSAEMLARVLTTETALEACDARL